jgi:hypothetical protein
VVSSGKGVAMITTTEGSMALDTLHGIVNSYVQGPRGRKKGATFENVNGQVKRARKASVSEEMIRGIILKASVESPNAMPDRIERIMRHYLD